jgi:hypothetical protein
VLGYIKPHYPELRGREAALYRAVYCGLCHTLSERYGMAARLLVNYDFLLPALLFWKEPSHTCKRRCIKSPLRGRPHLHDSPALSYATDAAILFTGWKLRDTIEDSRFPLPARLTCLFYRKHFRTAAERLQRENAICAEGMGEIRRLEAEGCGKLKAVSSFGEMLACLSLFYQGGDNKRAAHSLFFHLGCWITLIDAAEDMTGDAKSGRYNVLAAAGLGREDAFALMGREQELALAAFDLLPENEFSEIVRNILSHGLQSRGYDIYKKTIPKGGVSGGE